MAEITVRKYSPEDYPALKLIYEKAGFFDPETDKESRLAEKVRRDPKSLLIAVEENKIVGSVSLIEDGRIAQIFRLFSLPGRETDVLPILIKEAKEELKQRGYQEAHITALESDSARHELYQKNSFQKGNLYRWFYTVDLN